MKHNEYKIEIYLPSFENNLTLYVIAETEDGAKYQAYTTLINDMAGLGVVKYSKAIVCELMCEDVG